MVSPMWKSSSSGDSMEDPSLQMLEDDMDNDTIESWHPNPAVRESCGIAKKFREKNKALAAEQNYWRNRVEALNGMKAELDKEVARLASNNQCLNMEIDSVRFAAAKFLVDGAKQAQKYRLLVIYSVVVTFVLVFIMMLR